ncbi:cytochrome d ubiquinol oxidase subunit II, partial [Burkholderia multivorans]
ILNRTWLVVPVGIAVVAIIAAYVAIRAGAEKKAFFLHGLFLLAGMAAVFTGVYPNVLPSTLDPAFSLTVGTASSSDYTLGVMLIVTAIFLPIVIGYQIYSYRHFLNRIAES